MTMINSSTVIANGKVDHGAPNEAIYPEKDVSNGEQGSVTFLDMDNDGFHFQGVLIEEEKSVFQKGGSLKMHEAIPVIPKKIAIACLVLNCIFPGLGT